MEGKHDILEQKMCKEIELIESKYQANPQMEMSIQDLDKLDKLYHALKSKATYEAMKDAEDYEMTGYSGRRGRVPMSGNSYADGYSRGYSEAMRHIEYRPNY